MYIGICSEQGKKVDDEDAFLVCDKTVIRNTAGKRRVRKGVFGKCDRLVLLWKLGA